jgi:tRNA-specific 2-thiouridylase
MNIPLNNKKVAVAMSGGVDSSLTAALLLRSGYEVHGFTLQTWKEMSGLPEAASEDPFQSARDVATSLNIPFELIDVRDEFQAEIVEQFIQSYKNGLTPSPCVICNRKIKWKHMMAAADKVGAAFVATGHYARITRDENGLFELRMGKDAAKDQAYMLCRLTQKELSRTLFPLGEYNKTTVRKIAREFNIPSAQRDDSQDLCFLPDGDYRSFLQRISPDVNKKGDFLDSQGNKVGEHMGLAFYTIGQRKGLGIFRPEPLYVLEKNISRNEITVGPLEELGKREMLVEGVNWIDGKDFTASIQADVKIRYKAKLVSGLISPAGSGKVKVEFENPLRDITPGQVAVFYNEDKVLGGGNIAFGS